MCGAGVADSADRQWACEGGGAYLGPSVVGQVATPDLVGVALDGYESAEQEHAGLARVRPGGVATAGAYGLFDADLLPGQGGNGEGVDLGETVVQVATSE